MASLVSGPRRQGEASETRIALERAARAYGIPFTRWSGPGSPAPEADGRAVLMATRHAPVGRASGTTKATGVVPALKSAAHIYSSTG